MENVDVNITQDAGIHIRIQIQEKTCDGVLYNKSIKKDSAASIFLWIFLE